MISEELSVREVEVLRLAALGLSNVEIAKRLWVVVPTVKWHLNRAFKKLGASSRVAAVRRGMELGLVDLPVRLDYDVKACPHCGKAYV